MPDNKPNNINSDNNITPKPLEINMVNPETGNSDLATSRNVNSVPNGAPYTRPNPMDMLGGSGNRRRSGTVDNINRLNNSNTQSPTALGNAAAGSPESGTQDLNIAPQLQNQNRVQAPKLDTPAPRGSFLKQLDTRRQQLTDQLTPRIAKPSQYQAGTPRPSGTQAISAKIQEKSKEKMMLLAARLAAWFSSVFVTFFVWLIITIFALAILAALTMFILDTTCAAVQSAADIPLVGGIAAAATPQDIKNICEYYTKLKGGCFSSKSEEQKKVDLPTLDCIGKVLNNPKDAADSVDLNDTKAKVKAKKQVIKEIIKAGQKAGLSGAELTETVKYTIALYPLVSIANDWKESSGCKGIAQLCGDNTDPTSSYAIGTKGLIKTPEVYLPAGPNQIAVQAIQMKSINQFIKSRKVLVKKPEACLVDKIKTDEIYAIFYTWNNSKCDDVSQVERATKDQFAKAAKSNFDAMSCTEFNAFMELELKGKVAFEDRPYKQESDKFAELVRKSQRPKNLVEVSAGANGPDTDKISSDVCAVLKQYRPFMKEAEKLYASPFFPMSEYILGGMMMRESRVGTGVTEHWPKGCEGSGDRPDPKRLDLEGAGHGLIQADPTSGNAFRIGSDTPLRGGDNQWGKNVELRGKFGGRTINGKTEWGPYKWYDCRENTLYGAAHLVEMAFFAGAGKKGSLLEKRMNGLNLDTDSNGKYKDVKTLKVSTQLILDANNGGPGLSGCYYNPATQKTIEFCTSSRYYGEEILGWALQVASCFGDNVTLDEMLTNPGSGSGASSPACDSNGTSLNAQGAEFPLLTKKGSNVKIYYSQPYPQYIGGGAHNGMDISPGNNTPGFTRVASTVDGTIIAVGEVKSLSCNATCGTQNQRFVIIQEDGTPLRTTAIHLQIDDNVPGVKAPKAGDKVKKGTPIGIIADFFFVHLHFETRLNGVLQNPITQIKGFDTKLQPSNIRAESSIIDPKLYEKL